MSVIKKHLIFHLDPELKEGRAKRNEMLGSVPTITPHASFDCKNENTPPQRSEKTNADNTHLTKSEHPLRTEDRAFFFLGTIEENIIGKTPAENEVL